MGLIFASTSVAVKMRKLSDTSRHSIIAVPDGTLLDLRIKDHVDLKVFCGEKIVLSPDIAEEVLRQIRKVASETWIQAKVVVGAITPQMPYPHDVPYNVLQLQNHLIHKLDSTEPEILKQCHKPLVNIKQGYSRCSVLPIGDLAAITENAALGKILQSLGYDILIVSHGHVRLDGFQYGLFGGAGGTVEDEVIFNGCLSYHPDADLIKKFVQKHHKRWVELDDHQALTDCGSILYYEEEIT